MSWRIERIIGEWVAQLVSGGGHECGPNGQLSVGPRDVAMLSRATC
jgi:hypothetical protein